MSSPENRSTDAPKPTDAPKTPETTNAPEAPKATSIAQNAEIAGALKSSVNVRSNSRVEVPANETPEAKSAYLKDMTAKIKNGEKLSREQQLEVLKVSTSLILGPETQATMDRIAPMTPQERQNAEAQLGIPGISKDLDETTRGLVSQVATGYMRFDTQTNGWVDRLGGRVTLWPENISAIERFLKEKQPNHPYLTRTSDVASDPTGKYAYSDRLGMGFNGVADELQYNEKYRALQAAGKTPDQIQQELAGSHAATVGAQSAVEGYLATNAQNPVSSTPVSSDFRVPSSPAQSHIVNRAIGENPDMEKILDDVTSGLLQYDTNKRSWYMESPDAKSGIAKERVDLDFTDKEFQAIRIALLQTPEGRSHPFFEHTDSLKPSDRGYDKDTLDRIRTEFYSR